MKLAVVRRRRIWYSASIIFILIGLLSLAVRGLNQGIDFTGGTELNIRFQQAVDVAAVREQLAGHGMKEATIVRVGEEGGEFFIRSRSIPDEAGREAIFKDLATLGELEILGLDEVTPTISGELQRSAFLALLIAAVGMVLYITIRFEFKFAIAAIVALLHDVLITVGFFSLVGAKVDSAFVAAVLTIVGYSINDTIIVFDRIRENLKVRRKESFAELVDLSINQTLTRSINTSVTTLLAVVALFVFGGATIQDFALALLVGIGVGTYSSIFIAGPIWVGWKEREAPGH